MKVLVVGLNPSKLGGKSPSINTLNKWMDQLGLRTCSFINLYEKDICPEQCQIDLIRKMVTVNQYDAVICLGGIVSKQLYLNDIDHFRLPHPSPRNRQLNNKKYVYNELLACKNYLNGG